MKRLKRAGQGWRCLGRDRYDNMDDDMEMFEDVWIGIDMFKHGWRCSEDQAGHKCLKSAGDV